MSDWVGVVAGLAGVGVGAGATYVTQSLLWKRTARRDLYGRFASKCSGGLESLLEARYAVDKRRDAPERDKLWGVANAEIAQASALGAEIGIVASNTTSQAAKNLVKHLRELKNELYSADKISRASKDAEHPRSEQEYRERFPQLQDAFTSAARKELRIGG